MTVSSILICACVTLFVFGIATYIILEIRETKTTALSILIAVFLTIIIWVGTYVYINNTASGRRALKTQDSNFHNGIEREVTVYDMNGKVIEHFQGRFDVDYTNERIMFDDENGNRHIIYFKSGTVIINEIGEKTK